MTLAPPAERPVVSGVLVPPPRPRTPLVGRERELALAEASLEHLAAQAQQTGELARAELVGMKAREALVVVTRATAIQTAAPTAIAGGG